MLTLKNFELQVSSTIIQRGRQYFEDGAVIDLEETDNNYWQAEVAGTSTYSIEIKLGNKNKIEDYSCDCPYDGDTCKHVVAVLFLLKEELSGKIARAKKANQPDFKKLLQKINVEEYQEFILAHATKDKNFKSVFELWFAHKDERIDTAKKYTDLIKIIIRKHASEGFIDYRATYSLTNEIKKLVAKGDALLAKKNFREAFTLARAVLKQVTELIEYSDDSNGNIGDAIFSIIQLIENISLAKEPTIELKEQIFSFLQTELSNQLYFDYGDFGYEMITVYQSLAELLKKEKEFLQYVDTQIAKYIAGKRDFRKDYFLVRKIEFLKAIGKEGEIRKLIQQNLDVVEIRKGEVESAINKKDFLMAKKLIAGGIKIAEKEKHPGIVSDWEEELLRVAIIEKDKETIRFYTKRFAFDRWFNRDYYIQWKKTFTNTEWRTVIEKYIEDKITEINKQHQNNKSKLWYSPDALFLDALAPIYIEEKYWDRLLILVCKETELDRILQYHDHLSKHYPTELVDLYIPAFERKGDIAGNRVEYANLAGKMKRVIKSIPAGKEKIIGVAKMLSMKYPRRPAMIQELNKVIILEKGKSEQ
ncbi:SWIM zinc finger domain-containing protein [[Flexibacter] sp. ATCC 35208]|uniref:SWIM zinc finger family protein n=1 Tax=[Flexibacter] sp. ATCC 35208 TaxID=1936242 RepID=UPI0009C7D7C3|nr:SWIM zinc finger family protein [[Flexibacter] sp. ATCC 35208]OMP75000.1 hypothetical protein BW716_32480 [[Flexibacter] sp. ATCC 35208]